MTNKHVAHVLKETAALIELTGGNPFRSRAFDRAARTLERLDEAVVDRLADGTLTDVPGIGKGLAAQIEALIATGSFDVRDELLAGLPPGLLDTLKVKGLGAKKVRRLWKELGITSLDELERAAEAGRLATLDGFGKKSQANILHNVRLLQRYQQRRRYADTFVEVQPVLEALRSDPAIDRAELTGELRRQMETVGTADLLVTGSDLAAAGAAARRLLNVEATGKDSNRLVGEMADGLPLHVYLVPPERFGTAWWRLTGSDAHVAAFVKQHASPADHADEAALYERAGLAVVPPELREARGELKAAADDALPDLLTVADLHGSLHNHSTYSDGTHTLRQMAERARQMGLSYFGICDHSRSLKVANGMPIERVREQQEEIRLLNQTFAEDDGPPFHIFSGVESDVLADGSLDYPDDVLASFDFVVASVHTRFNMTETEATERVLRAIAIPHTTLLGHPTGRLLLAREGYPLDHETVIAACARHGVAIELNANPYRLDLDWRWIREATRQGVLIAINPDAHAMDQLPYVRWGVAVARKGWLTPAQCLNALPLDAFADWLAARKAERVA